MVDLTGQVAVHLQRPRAPHQARRERFPDHRAGEQEQEIRKAIRSDAEQAPEDDRAQRHREQRVDEQPQPAEHRASVHLPECSIADEAEQAAMLPCLGHRVYRARVSRRYFPPLGHILSIVALSDRAKNQTPPRNVAPVTAIE